MRLIEDLLTLYILIIFAAIILSWVPVTNSSSGVVTAQRVIAQLTEPVLRPLRAILPRPRIGMVALDLSAPVAILLIEIVKVII